MNCPNVDDPYVYQIGKLYKEDRKGLKGKQGNGLESMLKFNPEGFWGFGVLGFWGFGVLF